MSNQIFPSLVKGLSIQVNKTAEFSNLSQSSPNGAVLKIAQSRNPIWHWDLTFDYVYGNWQGPNNIPAYGYSDIDVLTGFFLGRQGSNDEFLFLDPNDYQVGPGLANGFPNPLASLQIVTDGKGNYYSPIQRNVGGQFWEDLTDVRGFGVFAGGIFKTQGTDYTIQGPGLAIPGYSFRGLYVKWNAQPTEPITAEFSFYHRVKFDGDTLDFEQWAGQLWTLGGSMAEQSSGLKLRSSRQLPIGSSWTVESSPIM
jgi:hypothetical protein